jgi:anti-sigma factor RsiW
MKCSDVSSVIGAYVDGETDLLQGHAIKRHLRACANCAAAHDELVALRAQIEKEVPRFTAPPALRARVLAMAEASHGSTPGRPRARLDHWGWLSAGAVAGCAATALAWVVATTVLDLRANEDVALDAVNSHVRATLGNQLMQVASSDQHTVKPWLSARLNYSPPVRDLAEEGFPLAGARIEYVHGQPVATLVYRFRNHTIDVFVRPELPRGAPMALRTVRGFNVSHAAGSGMDWLAVSDVSADVLTQFVERLARDDTKP